MTVNMQLELALAQKIDAHLNAMLRDMQTMLDRSAVWLGDMDVSQMSNLLSVAAETDSAEVVKNYVRYQMGRDDRGRSWARRAGDGLFGDEIVRAIDNLRGVAASMVSEVAPGLSQGDTGTLTDRAWMQLTRLYAGYMRRYFYYKKRLQRERN